VIDFWRALSHLGSDQRIHYVPVGRSQNDAAAAAALHPLWATPA